MNSAVDNPRFLTELINKFFDAIPPSAAQAAQPKPASMAPSSAELMLSDEGGAKFQSKCSACHTVGGGDSIGPDLQNVGARRERTWLVNYILEPDRMLAQHDPIAMTLFARYKTVRMPNLNLTLEDTEKVIKYIQTQSKVAGQHASGDAHP
jgi:protein SCO1/2